MVFLLFPLTLNDFNWLQKTQFFTMLNLDTAPTIVIDSREPRPSPWEQSFTLPTTRGTLATGDYSLAGCADWIAVERKSLDDLIACLCTGRDRFGRELARGARIPNFSIIVEARYSDIASGNYRSAMHPTSAWGSLIALQERHRIPFYFAETSELAARLCESILTRWLREHLKAVEACLGTAGPPNEKPRRRERSKFSR